MAAQGGHRHSRRGLNTIVLQCIYVAHKNFPRKTLRVHSARYTQCIHVSSRKRKTSKGYSYQRSTHPPLPKSATLHPPIPSQKCNSTPTHPFPKVQLYTRPPLPKSATLHPPTPSQKCNSTATHPFPKVQLYIVIKCRNLITRCMMVGSFLCAFDVLY